LYYDDDAAEARAAATSIAAANRHGPLVAMRSRVAGSQAVVI